jgi:cobalt-zinc-cadmium efflux system membrane fusion protein
MTWKHWKQVLAATGFAILAAGCGKKFNPAAGAPPSSPQVIQTGDMSLLTVDNAGQFALVRTGETTVRSQLQVTGTVTPDVSREVPVISLASGRVVDIKARLDDDVKKGQLLLRVQSPDITAAFDTYMKAKNDELLAKKAETRAQDLYSHGAIALSALEQAQNAEQDAQADLTAAENQLQVLGVDKQHPSTIVNVYAPISGVIVAQNVTGAAAAGVTYSGSATAFTIADLSHVWILCDVYENDLSKIQLGQTATIRTTAYPDRPLTGRVSDIGPILDPNLRTAKVRVEVANPGFLKIGMFVTAVFESQKAQTLATVPADAVLHLHDRDWVFVPAGGKKFRRVEVTLGDTLPDGDRVVRSGLTPGEPVIARALDLESAVETQ